MVRTVRGTVQVARHYEQLIEQQVFNLAKYGEGEVLPQLDVPLPKGCSPDGRGCGPLDAPGLDLARPDMEARKAS